MTFDATTWRISLRPAPWVFAILVAQALNPASAGPGPEETTKVDCGTNALFVLLRLEGQPVTLDRLLSALPERHKDGYSMAELSAASGSLGLGLEGIRFGKGDQVLGRPAIAFLKDAKGGHFAVLRPLGTTGTMIQVIDPPFAPRVVEYDHVFESKSWTGRVLVPREPWPARHATSLLAASGLALLVAAAVLHRARSKLARRVAC